MKNNENNVISYNTLNKEKNIYGSNMSFTDSYDINLKLIKKRIKSNNLKNIDLNIGTISNTKVSIIYIDGICKKELINNIYKKLKNINIDSLTDISYLSEVLNTNLIFPIINLSERPDKVCSQLLEGKIVILSDNSPNLIILPYLFIDFFHTMDDYYTGYIQASFIRIIRLLSFFIAIYLPGLYLSLTTHFLGLFNIDTLVSLKRQRLGVFMPSFLECLLIIIFLNILHESDLRKSDNQGSSISLLGGLILGEASIRAHLCSPNMIIVCAISTISSLLFNSYEFNFSIKLLRIILIIVASIFGCEGIISFTIILIILLTITKSFNIPYLYPIIPFDKDSIKDSFIRIKNKNKHRNKIFTNNINRGSL